MPAARGQAQHWALAARRRLTRAESDRTFWVRVTDRTARHASEVLFKLVARATGCNRSHPGAGDRVPLLWTRTRTDSVTKELLGTADSEAPMPVGRKLRSRREGPFRAARAGRRLRRSERGRCGPALTRAPRPCRTASSAA